MKLRTWCIRIRQLLTKTGLVLNMALLLMLVCCFCNDARAESAAQGITIRQQNASLEKIFQSIEKQTGYRFFYNESLLEGATKVSLNLQNVSLQEALDACFQNQPFSYAIVEKTIIIKRKVVAGPRAAANAPMNKIIAVRGKVTSGNVPVVGATVQVMGTDNGTSTDNDGTFTLSEVDDQSTLVVTHVAHKTRQVRLNGQSYLAIDLDEKVNELEESIVVAYNTTTTKRNTAAVTVVKGEQVATLPNRSVDKSLQGLVPGLLVTSGTGQPGGGIGNFVLRGIATGDNGLNGSTVRNPLIVVDGIPVTQDPQQLRYALTDVPVNNPLAQLNPSDIETISVLKDAAAVALYGSQASNGVILITTKKGKLGKTVFNIRHQTDISTRLKGKIQLLSQDEYLELLYETYKNTNAGLWTDSAILKDLKSKFPTRADGSFYPETDWVDKVYNDPAITLSNELSISGGTDKSTFYLNFEYTDQNGIFKKTGYDRKSVRFNFENRPTNWLKIGTNTTLSYNVQDYGDVGTGFPFITTAMNSPLNPVYLENGNYAYYYSFPVPASNPIAAMDLNLNRNTSYRGLSKIYGELSFLKNFKFTSNFGADFLLTESKEKFDPRLFDEYTYSTGSGRITERDSRSANLITTNILRYDKMIGKAHSLNVFVGQEARILTQKYLQGEAKNLRFPDYDQLNNSTTTTSAGTAFKQTLVSYFGQANYGFRNRYFLTSSLRRDGSSKFGERERFGTYWSTGLAWDITAEPFMKFTSSWLNYFKIRGSIGAAGNSGVITSFTRYDQLQLASYINSSNLAVFPSNLPGNPDIKWEETFTWDAGAEARFWNERIGLTVDIYKRKTTDIINSVNLALSTGYTSVLKNIGDIENKGVEIALSVDLVRTRDFQWNLNANWSSNKNILVKSNVPLATISGNTLANAEGKNFNSYYMPVWAGVNPDNGASQWFDSTGKPNSNYNAAKKEFVGKPQPDGFGAVTNTFTYKDFQVSALFYYQYGFKIYDGFYLTNDGTYPYANQDRRALNRWQKAGDIAENPKRVLNSTDGYQISTRRLYNGDYIRLQDVTISYNIPRVIISRLHISALRVYCQGHNLAVWTKYPGGDPADSGAQGYSTLKYPNQKTYSIGLNLSF